MRKFLGSVALGALALCAWAGPLELHLFWSATCPDCHVMKAFLEELAQEYPDLVVIDHEVTFNPDNWRLMVTLARAYGLKEETVPTVFVGDLAITGIGRAVELRIREEVERCLPQGCPSPMERLPEKKARVLSPLEIGLLLGIVVVVLLLIIR
ncbi:MAG: thioredoxin family protein [Candidatus Bipolaricaulota bacterium]|nr:thioredoxin family protein [Candidatus Bipolaricaulota bacterium]MDW8152564.1 thioredoxin family protein [Candidatus Bipolaricaulota bacterium]